ncbi:hypothetical protein GPECTOR_52g20 [Gonium pectorale]|uniref:Uncharacterized protein n=1 Tax=Gonium pectorale TaxID=33097 RepID=A0A150G710_GONPE|nr:hypothetical protein GPECTOR_52g20 [Gonium pectorale]|eukprot:KXZ45618.1 hypothetical protein GPECTOR_52g20 [Gonium pectorale]
MTSPLAAAAPSARTSVASYFSTSTVAPSDIDVSKALNLVHSMVSLPGSTARNSLELAPSSAATGPIAASSASRATANGMDAATMPPDPGRRSLCLSPCHATTAGGGVEGGGHRSTRYGATANGIMPSRPGTRIGRSATVSGITAPTPATPAPPTAASPLPQQASSPMAGTGPSPAAAALAEALAEGIVGAPPRNIRMSIDAAAGAEELSTRIASGTSHAVPVFRPSPLRPSPLAHGQGPAARASIQRQAKSDQVLRTYDADDDGPPVAPPGVFKAIAESSGDPDERPSMSSLARSSQPDGGGPGGDEWSFGGNLQRARMKARYAAIDVAKEVRYLPPSSAAGGARNSSGGGAPAAAASASEGRKGRKGWKMLASFAAKAIGGGKGKPVAPPVPTRQLPRPSMAEEPEKVQRSRDSRRLLLVQRVRVALDGDPPPVLQSQKRAAGPAAAALAAAKKKTQPEEEPPAPTAAAAAVDASMKSGGGAAAGAHAADARDGVAITDGPPADELDELMHAAAAAFAAATSSELSRGVSLV